jgi:hypothetical protein
MWGISDRAGSRPASWPTSWATLDRFAIIMSYSNTYLIYMHVVWCTGLYTYSTTSLHVWEIVTVKGSSCEQIALLCQIVIEYFIMCPNK